MARDVCRLCRSCKPGRVSGLALHSFGLSCGARRCGAPRRPSRASSGLAWYAWHSLHLPWASWQRRTGCLHQIFWCRWAACRGTWTGWLWIAAGVAGLGGAVVSDLADRNNPPITQALMLMMLSASLVLLAASPNQLGLAMFSALIFGGAYMSLTGLYLMTGIRLLPGRLSMGPVLPFMACALGQAVGSPVIGTLVDQLGYANAFFALFAWRGVFIALLSPLYPGHIDYFAEDTPGAPRQRGRHGASSRLRSAAAR